MPVFGKANTLETRQDIIGRDTGGVDTLTQSSHSVK